MFTSRSPSADSQETPGCAPELEIRRGTDGVLSLRLSGRWLLGESIPSLTGITQALAEEGAVSHITIDTQNVTAWDTALPVFLRAVGKIAAQHGVGLDESGLDQGLRQLLRLASAVPPREATKERGPSGLTVRLGEAAIRVWAETIDFVRFLGEVTLAIGPLVRGTAVYRRVDFGLVLQDTGPRALGIVSLISFLVGLILAFVGAIQLARFGAQIYIADLVGLAMAREMGPMMAGIIMAGRTGAAFAAQLGTMQVNQEIDALKTLGISPVEFLVLPRVLALILMMPIVDPVRGSGRDRRRDGGLGQPVRRHAAAVLA